MTPELSTRAKLVLNARVNDAPKIVKKKAREAGYEWSFGQAQNAIKRQGYMNCHILEWLEQSLKQSQPIMKLEQLEAATSQGFGEIRLTDFREMIQIYLQALKGFPLEKI